MPSFKPGKIDFLLRQRNPAPVPFPLIRIEVAPSKSGVFQVGKWPVAPQAARDRSNVALEFWKDGRLVGNNPISWHFLRVAGDSGVMCKRAPEHWSPHIV